MVKSIRVGYIPHFRLSENNNITNRKSGALKQLKTDIFTIQKSSHPVVFGCSQNEEAQYPEIKKTEFKKIFEIVKEDLYIQDEDLREFDLAIDNLSVDERIDQYRTAISLIDALYSNIDDEYLKDNIEYSLDKMIKSFKPANMTYNVDKYDEQEEKRELFYDELNRIFQTVRAYNELNNLCSPTKVLEITSQKIMSDDFDTKTLYKNKPQFLLFKIIGSNFADKYVSTFPQLQELFDVSRISSLLNLSGDDINRDYLYEKYYLGKLPIPEEDKETLKQIRREFKTLVFPSRNRENTDIQIIYNELKNWQKGMNDKTKIPKAIVVNSCYNNFVAHEKNCIGFANQNRIFIKPQNSEPEELKKTLRHELIHIADTSSSKLEDYAHNWGNYAKFPKCLISEKSRKAVPIVQDIETKWKDQQEESPYAQELIAAGVSGYHVKYAHTNHNEFIAVAGSAPDVSKYSKKFKNKLITLGLPKFVLELPPIEQNPSNRRSKSQSRAEQLMKAIFGDAQ